MLGLVFRTSCAPPRTAFQINLAGTPGFEPRISGLESDGLPLAYAPRTPGACGRTRTYEVTTDARFTVACLCCSATHEKEFQISNSRFQSNLDDRSGFRISISNYFVLK